MDGRRFERDGKLPLAFATWMLRLHAAGVRAGDAPLAEACDAVAGAADAHGGEVAAGTLLEALDDRLPIAEPGPVVALARGLYGDAVSEDFCEGDRAERTRRIRKYQFGRSLPWLARIQERQADGRVGPSWLVVEQVTDRVRALDPNPWNDIDERRQIPLGDFHVLWELDGCPSVHLR